MRDGEPKAGSYSDVGLDLKSEEALVDDVREFRRIVGSLQYITITRPDVQVAVNHLLQFMAAPQPVHWSAMKRILRFLSSTQRFGIMLRKARDFGITAYCDADWGGDSIDRKSRTSYLVYLGGTLVTWVSRKQSTLARSSTEAEYRAVESVKAILHELGVEVLRPMVILLDNLGATFITKNPIGHRKLKYVALDLHFVREKVGKGDVIVKHIPGRDQWTDVLTKALPLKLFTNLQSKLVGEPLRVWGGAC